MRQLLKPFTFLLAACVLMLTACVDEEQFDDTPQGNFEALWKVIDEHYCFLEYKQQTIGLDWQQVYQKYKVRVSDKMSSAQLFEVLSDMLAELRDGHVNLSASHNVSRYWAWHENYPVNFSDSLLRCYMGTQYMIASGLRYCILDDNIGYIRYESFNDGLGDGNIDEALSYMLLCRGLIIDIRSNGGGNITNAEVLAARFCNQETLVGYYQHKTGPGHSEFSDLEPRYLQPAKGIRWQKKACVLVNRGVFSAANEFAMYMKRLPNVWLVGDRTGGGAGMPFSSTLPNGWVVRFSAVPMYNADKECTEFGQDPDYRVDLGSNAFQRGEDDIIEYARKLLVQ